MPDKLTDAVRHMVYLDLQGYLSAATIDQVRVFASNLGIRANWSRFMDLRVTPDIARYPSLSPREIDWQFNRRRSLDGPEPYKYGDRLACVPGFYRRGETSPWRLALPRNSALFFYGSSYSSSGHVPRFYKGVLVQPLDRPRMFYLLSSSKYGGPKAAPLTPGDRLFFTQFEDA